MHGTLKHLTARPDVAALLEGIARAPVLETAIAIATIPAPTFHERARADEVRHRMEAAGLADVARDDVYNVYGRQPGADPDRPGLVISAHTDTVFDMDTDLTVKHRRDGRVCGPGLGDNSLGVGALLTLGEEMCAAGYRPPCDVWFVANAREEGLGNLGGIKAALARLGDRVGAVVVLEGLVLGKVYHSGIAVRRLKITFKTPGGHSWGSFGQPSAIHELMRMGARIAEMEVPETPRSAFNIGLVEGGQSINTIAPEASLYLDLRAETAEGVGALERRVIELVGAAQSGAVSEAVQISTTLVGDRPAGMIPRDHWLVQAVVAALGAVGLTAEHDAASTDANAVLAAGLPAVTVGVTYGGNAHRLDEYIEVEPIALGMRQLGLLVAQASDWLGGTAHKP